MSDIRKCKCTGHGTGHSTARALHAAASAARPCITGVRGTSAGALRGAGHATHHTDRSAPLGIWNEREYFRGITAATALAESLRMASTPRKEPAGGAIPEGYESPSARCAEDPDPLRARVADSERERRAHCEIPGVALVVPPNEKTPPPSAHHYTDRRLMSLYLPSTAAAAAPRSDAKSTRRLSSIITAGFSLLKSLGQSAVKRKREADELDADGIPDDDDSASKRARHAAATPPPSALGAAQPGASFITSSVRKTKRASPPIPRYSPPVHGAVASAASPPCFLFPISSVTEINAFLQ